jgi:5'-methylthioadenosine phosphorylase
VHHQAFADPYDTDLRQVLVSAAGDSGVPVHDGGTMVIINGPRFSTRAESSWFRQMGWSVVNMTGYPEAVLAAEAGLAYATVALVTDYDAGVDGHAPVTMEAVLDVMRGNVTHLRDVLTRAVPSIP